MKGEIGLMKEVDRLFILFLFLFLLLKIGLIDLRKEVLVIVLDYLCVGMLCLGKKV